MKKLYIDISNFMTMDGKTGIERVVRGILKAVLCNPPNDYTVIPVYARKHWHRKNFYAAHQFQYQFLSDAATPPPTNDRNHMTDRPIEPQKDDVWIGLDLAYGRVTQAKKKLKQYQKRGTKIYFVVYDIIPVLHPSYFRKDFNQLFWQWLIEISHYDGVFCISKAVEKQYRTWYVTHHRALPPTHHRIQWFHLGYDIKESLPTLGLPDEAIYRIAHFKEHLTFLTVATLEPRKGHQLLIETFNQLWQQGHSQLILVFVGKPGWMVEELLQTIQNHPRLNTQLFWLNQISDEYLEQVYQSSTCYLAASEAEGYGLPLIEAAHYQLPIIARDLPVFREVAKDSGAYFFDTQQPHELAEHILNWLQLYQQQKHPNSAGIQPLTWQQSAASLLKKMIPESELSHPTRS